MSLRSLVIVGLLSGAVAFGAPEKSVGSLCGELTKGISARLLDSKKKSSPDSIRHPLLAHLLTRLVKTSAQHLAKVAKYKREHPDDRTGYYKKFADAANAEGKMLIKVMNVDEANDTNMVVRPPQPGEKTVWEILTIPERLRLVEDLENIFQNGIYESAEDGERAESLTTHRLSRKYPVGFVPTRALAVAAAGGECGECRFSNSMLAGLLLELGLPTGDLRVAAGARHQWLEVRPSADSTWYVIDGTGTSRGKPHLVHRMATNRDGIFEILLPMAFRNRRSIPPVPVELADRSIYPVDGEIRLLDPKHGPLLLLRDENAAYTLFTDLARLTKAQQDAAQLGYQPKGLELNVMLDAVGEHPNETLKTSMKGFEKVSLNLVSGEEQAPEEAASAQHRVLARVAEALPESLHTLGVLAFRGEWFEPIRKSPAYGSLRTLHISDYADVSDGIEKVTLDPPPRLEKVALDINGNALPVVLRSSKLASKVTSLKVREVRAESLQLLTDSGIARQLESLEIIFYPTAPTSERDEDALVALARLPNHPIKKILCGPFRRDLRDTLRSRLKDLDIVIK